MRPTSSAVLAMVGRTYGKLTVRRWLPIAERTGPMANVLQVECGCGLVFTMAPNDLRRASYPSCGCGPRGPLILVEGVPQSEHPLYTTWRDMKQRCSNSNADNYIWYGGRGIAVCKRRQENFELFVADMGPKPTPDHTLDRINNEGNYEPSNCRWATKLQQRHNRRDSTT